MEISYEKLQKPLIDRDMKKKDLAERVDTSTYTPSKLARGENVMTDILSRICNALGRSFEDVMEIMDSER